MSTQQDTSTPAQNGSAPAPAAKHPFLTRPLYVYDLPHSLPQSLKLRSIDATDPASLYAAPEGAVPAPDAAAIQQGAAHTTAEANIPSPISRGANKVPPCTLCPSCPPFASLSAQRAHFRSDWHRYNVQLNHRGTHLVDEARLDKLCEEVDTAGETDTDEDAAKGQANIRTDTVTKLIQKLTLGTAGSKAADRDDEDEDDEFGDDRSARSAVTARSPLLWFTSREDADPQAQMQQTQLGIYRGIFPDPGTPMAPDIDPRLGAAEWYKACLSSMQAGRLTRKPGKAGSGWTGKRLKAQGAQDAAKVVMMTVLDGEGYLPGLKLESGRDSSDEDEDDSDSDDYGSDLDDGVSTATGTAQSLASSAISRNPESSDPPLRLWTVLLMGGGHFAAAVIALNPHVTTVKGRKGSGPREERSILLLAHKTFHRYTTRRKQGGGQAAQDATGRFAKSAGAQLRRYNESALGDDIRTLLDLPGWRELINRSERIWIRAGARAAKGTLWSWEGGKAARRSPLDSAKEDGRLDSLPFPTRRPTIGETVRCFFELTRVKIERKTDEELEALDQAYRESLSARSRKEAEARQKEKQARERTAELEAKKREREAATPKLSEEEKARRAKFERMVDMVRKGRLEALINFLGKSEAEVLRPAGWDSGPAATDAMPDDADDAAAAAKARVDARLPEWWLLEQIGGDGSRGAADTKLVPCTLLQLAAEAGADEVTRYLLVDRRADPSLPVERAGEIRRRNRSQAAATSENGEQGIVVVDTLTSADGEDRTAGHRAAYDLASNKETRNVFRKLMAEHPDWADWGGMAAGGARVPSALTAEMEETQANKVKDRRAALREKARERAAKSAAAASPKDSPDASEAEQHQQRVAAEEKVKESHGTTNRLGGASAAPRALLQQRDQQAGLTPEMRARIEREKRARAAEERLKKLSSGQ
ncbi:related to VMS1 - component of a Cdc48p-complex involved in protein quality control [Pseudozyma flocculosa]|uniref:Related to VMS1 - component of a Cdc48p-complex involved in protein quality control n=1 Tax=Pseudozyma flocculosa TaxID=84751 RepID=A0A5C3F2S7_9BASI|nr:related to VMS1 - component of a Cdc48p-complex involved in protein quality control [Pseudozyma flocculosa]